MALALPRCVLKWLQGLQLSCSVRNPRRDVANGFVVAEVITHYDGSVVLATYDTATSLAARLNNWQQLETVFARLGLLLPRTVIDSTLHGKPGAAELLLCLIYDHFTGRRCGVDLEQIDLTFSDAAYENSLPFHARATTATALKNNIRPSELVMVPDLGAQESRVARVMTEHQQHRRRQREGDPDRFGIKVRTATGHLLPSSGRATLLAPLVSAPERTSAAVHEVKVRQH